MNNDLISRQQAIDALAEDMPSAYTPDGSHPADEGIFMAQEIYADCIQTLKELPPAQPEQLEQCPIYGGMCAYPSDQCYDCPRHAGAKMEVTT